MSRRTLLALAASALVLAACGGESASSDIVDATSGSTPASESTSATRSTSETSATTSPADVLVDSSYDIGAVDGPVVLWFWAPG